MKPAINFMGGDIYVDAIHLKPGQAEALHELWDAEAREAFERDDIKTALQAILCIYELHQARTAQSRWLRCGDKYLSRSRDHAPTTNAVAFEASDPQPRS